LPPAVRLLVDEAANEVFVSAASVWEIATKYRTGKLPEVEDVIDGLDTALLQHGFTGLPANLHHGHRAGLLGGAHRDPFDRMLIAQALSEDLVLVSNERLFDGYGVKRLW
jgi:PIN domain nuclease of toxin-antitoxin system